MAPLEQVALTAGAVGAAVFRRGERATLAAVDSLLASRVAGEIVDRVLASALARRTVDRALEAGIVEHAAARLLEGPELERVVESALDSPAMDRLIARVMQSEDLWRVVDEIAHSPEVTDAIARQSIGFADQVAGGVRTRSRSADAWIEAKVRQALRREPPASDGR
jgi:hypothetical protein